MFACEEGVSEVTQGTALGLVMTWVVWIYGWGFCDSWNLDHGVDGACCFGIEDSGEAS
jgi:hypothetical protein